MGAARPGSRKVVGNKRPTIDFEGSLVTRFILVDHTSANIPTGHIHIGYSQDLDALESGRHQIHPPLIGKKTNGFVIKAVFIQDRKSTTSELQSLMRISFSCFFLNIKQNKSI